MPRPINGKRGNKVNLWEMLRDVLVASMNKGQFPLAICGLIFIVMVLRMPPQDVSKLVFEIVEDVKEKYFVGDILAGVALVGWFIHAKWQRKLIHSEMERMATERNKAQEVASGRKSPSSKKN
jgi:hypothetical protein